MNASQCFNAMLFPPSSQPAWRACGSALRATASADALLVSHLPRRRWLSLLSSRAQRPLPAQGLLRERWPSAFRWKGALSGVANYRYVRIES